MRTQLAATGRNAVSLAAELETTNLDHDEEHEAMSNKLTSVLIVDDDHDLRDVFASLLADCGFRVRTAADGVSALVEMKSELPDVLVSDLEMPIMNGFELLSIVRSHFPVVGVIAMSGAYSSNEVPGGVAADAFYPKGGACTNPLPQMVNAITERCGAHTRRCVA
jgi:CheY-like chemotaxis protein